MVPANLTCPGAERNLIFSNTSVTEIVRLLNVAEDANAFTKLMGRPREGADLDIIGGLERAKVSSLTLPSVDLYWSLNSFWAPKKRAAEGKLTWMRGTTKHLAALNAVWVDLDHYRSLWKDSSADEIQSSILDALGSELKPNLFVSSGRGSYIVFLLENINHASVGKKAFWEAVQIWKRVSIALTRKLEQWGSDSAASTSPSGVLRFPNSINSKSGKMAEYRVLHEERFKLKDLEERLGAADRKLFRVGNERRAVKGIVKSKPLPAGLKKGSLGGLMKARMDDLELLKSSRNASGYDWRGIRNKFCFTYAQTKLQEINGSPIDMDELFAINDSFDSGCSKKAEEWEIRCVTRYRSYSLRNWKIIADLEITEEEMRRLGLKTLISRKVKNERRRLARNEGIDGRRERSAKRDEGVLAAVEKGAGTVEEVIVKTGLSRPSVYRALKGLGGRVVSISGRLAVGGLLGGVVVNASSLEKGVGGGTEFPARTALVLGLDNQVAEVGNEAGGKSKEKTGEKKFSRTIGAFERDWPTETRKTLVCVGESLIEGAWLLNGEGQKQLFSNERDDVLSCLLDPELRVVGMDLKAWLKEFHITDIKAELFDVRVAAFLVDSRIAQWGWKRMAARFFDEVGYEEAKEVLALAQGFEVEIAELGLGEVFAQEIAMLRTLDRIERRGIGIDGEALELTKTGIANRLQEIEEQVAAIAGAHVDMTKPQEVGSYLYDTLKLPVLVRTKNGKPSTDLRVVEELGHVDEKALLVSEFRRLHSALAGCIDPLLESGKGTDRISPTFNQAASLNGRLSAKNPNIQGIVSGGWIGQSVRGSFKAREGKMLVGFDLSQIEIRALAHLSGDEALMDLFRQGGDIYAQTAAKIKGVSVKQVSPMMRSWAKEILISCIYGMGAKALAVKLRSNVEEAKRFIEAFDAAFPRIKTWKQEVLAEVRQCGFVVLPNGVRRFFDRICSADWRDRFEAERQAINAVVQGTAAIWFKKMVAEIEQYEVCEITNLVHDEILMEVSSDRISDSIEAIRKTVAKIANEATIPLEAKIGVGRNWREVHYWGAPK